MFGRRGSGADDVVRVVGDTLVSGARIGFQIRPDQVRRVEMYKRDQITIDLVCCDIVFDGGDGVRITTFHEELDGWNDLLAWLGTLPGFRTDWQEVVIKPAFAENRMIVFHAPS